MRPAAQAALLLLLALPLLAGCGRRGAPLPPEPRGPRPPAEVAARQIGDRVVVSFRVPPARGDRPMQQPVKAELVRVAYAPGVQPAPDPDAFRRRGQVVASLAESPLPEGGVRRIVDGSLDDGSFDPLGWTLRYGVRVRDGKGRSSPLVVALDLVPATPPQPPGALRGRATADGVRLEWDSPPGDTPRGYNVYRWVPGGELPLAPLNGSPLGTTDYVDREVEIGATYVYEVRAVIAAGPPRREGAGSARIRVVAEDRFPPARPDGLVAVQEGRGVRLFWNPNAEPDLAGYRVYRAVEDGAFALLADGIDQSLYLDREVAAGQFLRYRVSAIDRANPPNESLVSTISELEVGVEAP